MYPCVNLSWCNDNNATEVDISNSYFRSKWRVLRVHRKKLERFAERLRPFFLHYEIWQEQTVGPHSFGKNMLCLFINEKGSHSGGKKIFHVDSIPSQEEIDKELGFSSIV